MARAFAWAIALRSGNEDRFNTESGPGKHWWRNFRARHPQLTLRTSDNLERSRAQALTKEIVDDYFACLRKILDEKGLINCPRQLFNCDETYLPLNIMCEKVIARKNTKHVYSQSRGTSDHITLLCCASAAGIALPPMIIYSKSFPGGNYRFDGPDDALYARSESGWIDGELFLSWMKKIFIRYCGTERPVILFVDGHASHISLDVIDLARENDIVLFCLPPHTTHALQPLDVSVFKSLKSHFSKAVQAVFFAKKDFIVSKREFARVVKVPFERAFSISNIKAGFAKCGIFPYNPNAIDRSKIAPSLSHSSSSTDESTLALDSPQCNTSSGVDTPTQPNTSSSVHTPTSSVSVPSSDDTSMSSVNPSPIVSSLACSPEVSVVPVQASTPVSLSSPVTQVQLTPPSFRPAVENPLVRAGLVPEHLADIFLTANADEANKARASRRITGVRVLTSEDYVKMVREKEKKEKDAAEQKQKRKEERELKKMEKEKEQERKRKEREAKKRDRQAEGKGRGKKRKRPQSPHDHNGTSSESEERPTRSSTRSIRAPQRYCNRDSDSDDSGTLCMLCSSREPPVSESMVFWVDCDSCGEWAHTYCALGSNTATRAFICSGCST